MPAPTSSSSSFVPLPDGRTATLRPLTPAEMCTCPLPCGACATPSTVPADLVRLVQWVAATPGCTHRGMQCNCGPVALAEVMAAADPASREALVADHVAALAELSAHVDAAWAFAADGTAADLYCPDCLTDPDMHAARLDGHEVSLAVELSAAITRFSMAVVSGSLPAGSRR